jgi:glucokinase
MPQHPYDLSNSRTNDGSNSNAGDCVAAVDIGGTNLRLAIADLQGNVLARWSASTVGLRDPQRIVDLICEGVARCLAESSLPKSSLRAIGAGVPGITDSEHGLVVATSYLLGWRDVLFRDMLEATLKVPAAIENDVNLGAVGERWLGAARSVQDFIFLAIGTGLGAGIFLNGKLFQGSRWTAGEVGYMLVPGTSTAPVGSGQPGALESMVGGEGIRAQWHRLWDAGGVALPRDLTATEIFDHALVGDAGADAILQQTARMLSYAIYNIWLIFNSPLFVLGGTVGLHPALVAATKQHLQQLRGTMSLKLAVSSLAADAQLVGAIRLALDTEHGSRMYASADPLRS